MMTTSEAYSTFLLIDTAQMIGHAPRALLRKRHRPSWLQPVYDPDAIAVTPIVIDVEKAYEDGRIGDVMRLTNCWSPQLHVSVIHAHLSLTAVVDQLRCIAYVFTEGERQLTLRFADCVVAKALASVLTEHQWSQVASPFKKWLVHELDTTMSQLPLAGAEKSGGFPLVLKDAQLEAMKAASRVHKIIADIKQTTPSVLDQPLVQLYGIVEKALAAWLDAGGRQKETLLEFATHAVRTNGAVFNLPSVHGLLIKADLEEMRRQFSSIGRRG
jgi:hypothetical protein